MALPPWLPKNPIVLAGAALAAIAGIIIFGKRGPSASVVAEALGNRVALPYTAEPGRRAWILYDRVDAVTDTTPNENALSVVRAIQARGNVAVIHWLEELVRSSRSHGEYKRSDILDELTPTQIAAMRRQGVAFAHESVVVPPLEAA